MALDADLDVQRRRRPVELEEVLAVGPLDADIEVVVRVGPVEVAPGRVVDAEVAPAVLAPRAEPAARAGDPFVGDLPVEVKRVGAPDHRGDAVVAVGPGELEPVETDGGPAELELRFFDDGVERRPQLPHRRPAECGVVRLVPLLPLLCPRLVDHEVRVSVREPF